MKRFMILMMALGLLAGSVATAEAAKKTTKPTRTERTVEGKYGPYPAPVTGCNEPLGQWACVAIPTRTDERFLTAKVTDTHGQPVFVEVRGGNGVQAFCGETTEPISFSGGSTLYFHVGLNNWLASLHCPAHRIKTTGTITVTLSNTAARPPVRSGSIVTGAGWVLDGQLGGCQMSPECGAWLATDCLEGRVTEWEPGLTASIVDVDELADGPSIERVFRFGNGWSSAPVWGGVQLQFWTSDCTEIPEARWRSTDCDGNASERNCSSLRFRIPVSAKWMTVTGYQDSVNLTWTVT